MGLFSSSTKTYVSTGVQRVIKDDVLPNAIKTGVIKSIFEEGDIPEYVMEELVGSIGLRADRLYEYGRTKYTHGLPSGQIKTAIEGKPEVTAVLSTLEGVSVLLIYCHYGPPNMLHIGWTKLISDHGYDPATNQLAGLTATKGTEVYLNDMTVVVPAATFNQYEPNALAQWGIPATAGNTPQRQYTSSVGELRAATPVLVDPAATTAHVRVDYVWEEASSMPGDPPITKTGTFNIDITGYVATADYYHAKYTASGVTKYWMYQAGLGTYPTLDVVFDTTVQTNGTFFPFAYFRYNKHSEITDKTTDVYKTSKKLVKYLGMDYDMVATTIDDNPDIADVEQAMLVMAVPANTAVECERRYLFSFFDNLFYTDTNQFSSLDAATIAARQWDPTNKNGLSETSLVIQDKRFKMTLSNSGIYKKRVVGKIGAIGSHFSGVGDIVLHLTYTDALTDLPATQDITIKYHYYQRQISDALYDEIQVVNLKMRYYIFEEYHTTGDEMEDILLIPLDRSITELYSVPEREELYARSLHYVFNSRTVVELAWYQSTFFQFIMLVVTVVIMVYSMGSAYAALVKAAALAHTTVTFTAVVWALFSKIITGLVIGAVFKLFVKLVGVNFAMLAAIVAAAVGFYQAFEAGSIAGAPWAQTLLQLSSGLTKGISAEIKALYSDLLAEYESFNLFKDEKTKELEAANKLLEHNNFLNPFVIFGESPNDFYNRTIHSGNIGVQSISAISSYVDIALTLPKLDETLEG